MSTLPPSKRQRQDNGKKAQALFPLNGIISPSLFSSEENLQKAYLNASPFKHGFIEKFCVDGFLEKVLEELKQNSKVKFKESDLFRVYQSIDLGNLHDDSPDALQIPSLMQLKKKLYSKDFRGFMEKITGIESGTLTEQVDCAANCHTRGCHLLCHDDVIGNRKISFIIYLTDPEPEWCDEDGGRLELYESIEDEADSDIDISKRRRVPKAFPSKTILPLFNSLAYFVVSPGESFHSVQEVFCDRPRLTIQGWFHAKDPPCQREEATLNRLKSTAKGEDTEGPFSLISYDESETQNSALTEADIIYLSSFINDTYLKEEAIKEIREQFEEDSSVQLRNFIRSDVASKINNACKKIDDKDKVGRGNSSLTYDVGTGEGWEAVGPAHKQRFLKYEGTEIVEKESAGALLEDVQKNLFQSPIFGKFLRNLSSLGLPIGHRGKIRRFRPGLDYTVAHYGILTTSSVLDTTLCFVAGDGSQPVYDEVTEELIGSDDDALWASGDVGGFECYIAAEDDDNEADEEYDAENDAELLSVSACNNTLSLVYRDPGTMRFVKYVGSGAPGSRWDLSLEYEINNENEK